MAHGLAGEVRAFANIQAFLTHLATVPTAVHAAEKHGGKIAGEALVKHAKDLIGMEQEAWPALADSTVARKQMKGWTGRVSATDPLLARGDLRDSISATVDGHGVTIGSTDRIALYQELGTSRIPPRPFISATMSQHGHAAAELAPVADAAVKALAA